MILSLSARITAYKSLVSNSLELIRDLCLEAYIPACTISNECSHYMLMCPIFFWIWLTFDLWDGLQQKFHILITSYFIQKKKKQLKNYFFPVFHMSYRLVLLLCGVKAIKAHPFFAVPYSSILFYFPLCLSPAYSKQFATFQSYFIQKLLNLWPLLLYLCITAAVFCEMMIHLAVGAPG